MPHKSLARGLGLHYPYPTPINIKIGHSWACKGHIIMDALMLFLFSFIYAGLPLYCAVMIYRIGRQLERDMDLIYDNFEKRLELDFAFFKDRLGVEADIPETIEREVR